MSYRHKISYQMRYQASRAQLITQNALPNALNSDIKRERTSPDYHIPDYYRLDIETGNRLDDEQMKAFALDGCTGAVFNCSFCECGRVKFMDRCPVCE